jgi:PAS domain S-box-containing protein
VANTQQAEDTRVDRLLDDLLSTLGRTSDAMVAVGPDARIVAWNDAATGLFGLTAEEAIGLPCASVMCWRDRCGDPVCGDCGVETLTDDELMPTRDVLGRTADGRTLWLSATSIVPPPDLRDRFRLVHLVREIGLPPELERLIIERLQGGTPAAEEGVTVLDRLTARESEILRLLADGFDGSAIAEDLYLSPATVRNHIQHILKKLEVHSRTEAVALVLRNGRPRSG